MEVDEGERNDSQLAGIIIKFSVPQGAIKKKKILSCQISNLLFQSLIG